MLQSNMNISLNRLFHRFFKHDQQSLDYIDITQDDDDKRPRLQKEFRMEEIQDPTSFRSYLSKKKTDCKPEKRARDFRNLDLRQDFKS